MLTELTLKDWKSFDQQFIAFGPVTLLIGANASGKSNLLDALRFLQGIGLGLPIADVLQGRWESGREVWPGIRGGTAEAARAGKSSFMLQSGWRIEGAEIRHTIACRTEPEPAVVMERLQFAKSGAYLFDTHAPMAGEAVPNFGGALGVALRGKAHGRPAKAVYSSTRSLLGQIQPDPSAHCAVMKAVLAMRRALGAVSFLEIRPSRMRGYVPQTAPALGENGENISAVLFRYCQDDEQKQALVDWISDLCAPPVVDIAFSETEFKDVLLALVEKGNIRISARSVSEGTLRFLGELTALITAEKGAVLMMEEIESGLHPARAGLLVEILESVTQGGVRQVIATTHSPVVLHALSSEALGNAIVFGRHADEFSTRMKRLVDLPHFAEVLERRGIEHLFTTKWLERAL
jgi:hypothetical protein